MTPRRWSRELRKYDEALYRKPRWLVFNKLDLIPEADRGQARTDAAPAAWASKRKSFTISALTGEGCRRAGFAIMDHLQDGKPRTSSTESEARTTTA